MDCPTVAGRVPSGQPDNISSRRAKKVSGAISSAAVGECAPPFSIALAEVISEVRPQPPPFRATAFARPAASASTGVARHNLQFLRQHAPEGVFHHKRFDAEVNQPGIGGVGGIGVQGRQDQTPDKRGAAGNLGGFPTQPKNKKARITAGLFETVLCAGLRSRGQRICF